MARDSAFLFAMFALPQGIIGNMRSCSLFGGPSLSSVCGLSCRAVASASNQPSTSSSGPSAAPQGKHTVLLEGVASPSWPVQPLQQKLVAKYSPWEITRNLARKSGYQRCACSPCACSAPCMGGCGSRGTSLPEVRMQCAMPPMRGRQCPCRCCRKAVPFTSMGARVPRVRYCSRGPSSNLRWMIMSTSEEPAHHRSVL